LSLSLSLLSSLYHSTLPPFSHTPPPLTLPSYLTPRVRAHSKPRSAIASANSAATRALNRIMLMAGGSKQGSRRWPPHCHTVLDMVVFYGFVVDLFYCSALFVWMPIYPFGYGCVLLFSCHVLCVQDLGSTILLLICQHFNL
jgi:hypothetical protein